MVTLKWNHICDRIDAEGMSTYTFKYIRPVFFIPFVKLQGCAAPGEPGLDRAHGNEGAAPAKLAGVSSAWPDQWHQCTRTFRGRLGTAEGEGTGSPRASGASRAGLSNTVVSACGFISGSYGLIWIQKVC